MEVSFIKAIFVTMEDTIDLFDVYETLPQTMQKLLLKWGIILEREQSYTNCNKFLEAVKKHGYTFEYYLDAMPYNLRKITITHTIEGYKVKDLVWRPVDNIYVGLVQDPQTGREDLHDGYVSATWRKNGTWVNKSLPKRKDLKLNLDAIK